MVFEATSPGTGTPMVVLASTRSSGTTMMRTAVWMVALLLLAACDDESKPTIRRSQEQMKPTYALPKEIALEMTAVRGEGGKIFIVGSTNLPEGTTVGAELRKPNGHVEGQDFKIRVIGGRFRSTGFTDGGKPISPGNRKVHVLSIFNGAWQSPDILKIVGSGGANLRGSVIKLEDPAEIDSDKIVDATRVVTFPPLSEGAKAIVLVKRAILTVDGSRSAADVDDTVAMFMKFPGLRVGAGWSAKI
jgi:hypothetical protein